MAITLGGLSLDEAATTVVEKREEVGGRDARTVRLSGVVLGERTAEAIETRLDAVLSNSSSMEGSIPLSLRADRRLWVRRMAFSAEVAREALAGSFELKLEAENPFEESIAAHTNSWSVSASGSTTEVVSEGSAGAVPVVTLVASGDVVNPCISDGIRSLAYEGIVPGGSALVLDGERGIATLDGEDVTAYTEGSFVQIAPAGTTLTYTDGTGSSHCAAMTIVFRDRWW